MAPMLALLAHVASAAGSDHTDLRWGISAGMETDTSSKFLHRTGGRLGATYAPRPWVDVGFSAAYYPIFGEEGENDPDWTPLAQELASEHPWWPTDSYSKLHAQVQATVRVHAMRIALDGNWHTGFGLIAGVGLFATKDTDLVVLSEKPPTTLSQIHAGPVAGVFWEVRSRRVGVRVRYESDAYVEVEEWTNAWMTAHAMLGAEVLCWF